MFEIFKLGFNLSNLLKKVTRNNEKIEDRSHLSIQLLSY